MEKILRICTRCDLKAKTIDDLNLFVKDKYKDKFYYTKSICKKCNAFDAEIKRKGMSFLGPELIKRCKDCNFFPNSYEELEQTFIKDKSMSDGYGSLCKKCRNKRQNISNEKRRDYIRKRQRRQQILSYNISVEKYEEILKNQNNCCPICKNSLNQEKKYPSIDHDHSCCEGKKSCGKCVRGVICNRCNTMLGMAKDDTIVLENAIKYLKGVSKN
jgi:hypothetical protein